MDKLTLTSLVSFDTITAFDLDKLIDKIVNYNYSTTDSKYFNNKNDDVVVNEIFGLIDYLLKIAGDDTSDFDEKYGLSKENLLSFKNRIYGTNKAPLFKNEKQQVIDFIKNARAIVLRFGNKGKDTE